MRFPSYRRAATYRMTVPALTGGINAATDAFAIKDHQMSSLCNLWVKNGALRTRPGLEIADITASRGLTLANRAQTLSNERVRYGEREGRLIATMGKTGQMRECLEVALVEEDGSLTVFSDDTLIGGTVRHLMHVRDGKQSDSLGLFLTDCAELPLLRMDEDGLVTEETPYVPTVQLRAPGDGQASFATPAGVPFEGRNMLTDAYRINYAVGQTATFFHLLEESRAGGFSLQVTGVDSVGEVTHTVAVTARTLSDTTVYYETAAQRDGYRLAVDRQNAVFWFVSGSGSVPVDVSSTPYVELDATVTPDVDCPESRRVITGMTCGTWFGGDRAGLSGGTRYFVAGNPEHPHLLHYSSLNDPTYFPEDNYVYVGRPTEAITALKQQGNLLVIFKERELYTATYSSLSISAAEVAAGEAVDVEAMRACFPLTPVSNTVGCDCPGSIVLCGNRLVWATSAGKVYTLHGANSVSERNVRELSTPIEPLLHRLGYSAYLNACGVDYDGCYVLCLGEDVFVFHYDEQSFYNYSSFDAGDKPGKILAWHHWKLPYGFTYRYVLCENETLVFLSEMSEHLVGYSLTGTTDTYFPEEATTITHEAALCEPIASSFSTKLYDFGSEEQRKQIKRLTLHGEAESEATEITVFYLTERGKSRGGVPLSGNELSMQLHPNGQRCRRFGICCEAVGPVTYHGFCVRYELQG